MNRKRIKDLLNKSTISEKWNFQGYKEEKDQLGLAYSQHHWNLGLVETLNKLSLKTKDVSDCTIVSAEIGAILADNIQYVRLSQTIVLANDIEKVAILGGKFKIYIDPYLPANLALVGVEEEMLSSKEDIKCGVLIVDNLTL